MGKRRGELTDQVDTDQDRYPNATEGLRRIIKEGNLPDGPIESLEVTFLANGSCTYRVRAPRADETEDGYLP